MLWGRLVSETKKKKIWRFKRKWSVFIDDDDYESGDDGGDDGDGVTPLVTAIRGSPSPLSQWTACSCGSTVINLPLSIAIILQSIYLSRVTVVTLGEKSKSVGAT